MNLPTPARFYRNYRFIYVLLLTISCLTLCYYYYADTFISMPYQFANEGNIENMKNYLVRSNEYLSAELKVDRSHMSEAELLNQAQQTAPNFPILFWEANKNRSLYYKNSSCSPFPNVYNLKVNNLYWQLLRTTNATYYLFGAYYDVRKRCSICPAVRLLGTIDRQSVKTRTFCQIWFADIDEPLIVESSKYFYLVQDDNLSSYPGFLTCPIPPALRDQVPIFVSLVENLCDHASNSLRVIFNKPDNDAAVESTTTSAKAGFAVCVKMLDFLHDDQSLRLTEWIELVRLLGADKIILYTLFIHENMTKVLKYYEERGELELTPTTLVDDQVNLPYFQHLQLREQNWMQHWVNEIVQLNDCFYKNMYKYDYITMLDTDEVIMPHKEYDWRGLMKSTLKKLSSGRKESSFETSMVIFPNCKNGTGAMMWYMLDHIHSDRGNSIQETKKTFFDTERVEAVNNHRVVKCLTKECKAYEINRRDAELFHYRDAPFNEHRLWSCEQLVKKQQVDTTIWKYKEQLIDRTMFVLHDLGFYG